MDTVIKNKRILTPNEAADLLMISPVTVRQWAQKGKLKAVTTPGGHRRFMYEDLLQFANTRGLNLMLPEKSVNKILIVDDDRFFAQFLTTILASSEEPVETEVAYDGFEAGLKVRTFQPQIVLLDIMMPGLDGFEVCKRIKSDPESGAVRVIAMTGNHTKENEQRMKDAGAEICLKKPFDRELVLTTMGIT